MNIFRLCGDVSHLFAIFLLLSKIWKTRSTSGISGKSQVNFLIVFICRYLDLFITYISLYNTLMKLFFIGSAGATVYFTYVKFRSSNSHSDDVFKVYFLYIPCALLALIINHQFSFVEILWTYSIYLEAVAILPQLFLIVKTGEAESITSHYLFALGSYRAFYLLNWFYRYFVDGHLDWISIIAGIAQTLLYCDFFYLYITKVLKGKTLRLPSHNSSRH